MKGNGEVGAVGPGSGGHRLDAQRIAKSSALKSRVLQHSDAQGSPAHPAARNALAAGYSWLCMVRSGLN